MDPFSILGSLFLGSSLARIFTTFLINRFSLNFFSDEFSLAIPGFSQQLGVEKTYDILNSFLFFIFSILIFSTFFIARKIHKKEKQNKLLGLIYLTISFLVFLQVNFVNYSGSQTIFLIAIIQGLYILGYIKIQEKKLEIDSLKFSNGVLSGFYLLLIFNRLTTLTGLQLGIFATMPFVYLLLSKKLDKFSKSPAHLILVFSALFPFNIGNLLLIALVFIVFYLLIKDRKAFNKTSFIRIIYPIVILFIFAYNPLFYMGSFDSIEEGFWLGWLQRLLFKQKLYSDVAVYHPPFIVWGLYYFTKIFGVSMYHFRLYLHTLQIFGLILIFFVINKLINKTWIKAVLMWLILSFTAIGVKNNIEIRLGMGFLSTVPLYFYLNNRKRNLLILSGIFSAASVLTSVEVGLASILSIIIGISFLIGDSLKSRMERLLTYLFGLTIGLLPFVLVLISQSAFNDFISQLTFYSRAFSKGYLNSSIERSENLTLLQWHFVNRYLSSTGWFWELARLGTLATFIYLGCKFVNRKLEKNEKYVAILIFMNLFMFRSALGRSDIYHLLFVIIPSLIFIAYFLENFFKKEHFALIFLLFMALFFFRTQTQLGFFQNQLIKFQTYGNPAGNYPSYDLERAGILTGIDVDTKSYREMILYIKEQVSQNESIFVYPGMPEVYFLTERKNSTSFDTPLSFFTDDYQRQMIKEIEASKPKLIIYNPKINFGTLNAGSLSLVNDYILSNFIPDQSFRDYQLLKVK